MVQVGFVYNALVPDAPGLIDSLVTSLNLKSASWVCSAEDLPELDRLDDTNLIVVAGGDGTILKTVHVIAPFAIPIVAVNMGRVGFMSELSVGAAAERLPAYLNGDMRIERRMMLCATVTASDGREVLTAHALNDVVVGRGGVASLMDIATKVDGEPMTRYRSDAVVVATATGSTGYALSAGAQIFFPEARVVIVQPVAPHTGLRDGLVLPDDAVVELEPVSRGAASLSVDGLADVDLAEGSVVKIVRSEHEALFLRARPPAAFWGDLTSRLGLVYNLTPPRQ